jgi:tetratricopeptide (TPR) repeat protein
MSKTVADRLLVLGLLLCLATVLARAAMLESVTAAERSLPQAGAGPRQPGSATGVVLDLLCCLPALVVLGRRAAFPAEVNRSSFACRIAAILGGWVAISAFWADDKFSAAVNAAHLLAAFSLLWAAAQCVTTPRRLRLVVALAFGLLLLQLVQAIQWRFFDLPQTITYYQQHKDEILASHGWKADDFLARQYESKLLHREMLGFTSSANSFAAVLVLLMGISAGLAIQRWLDAEGKASAGARIQAVLIGLILPVAIWILGYTQSKGAFVTPIFICAILLVTARFRNFLHTRPRAAYAIGAAVFLLIAGTVVAYGVTFHTLPGASLNFRWRYWVAAWRMFLDHPLFGVGWNNFGPHYLHYRLPAAAEEILDPHDFLLRFLTETGIIGAGLAIAWVGRLWWEMTGSFHRGDAENAEKKDGFGLSLITWAVVLAFGINVAASVDFTQTSAYIMVQLFNRAVLFACLLGGAWIAAAGAESRRAPWVLYALLASLGAFLVHNLIEFSLFEPGPMMLFALLAGSALGMRQQTAAVSRPRAVAELLVAGVAWAAAAIVFVGPIVLAQESSNRGDDHFTAQHFDEAVSDYAGAAGWCPFNADYLYRQGLAEAYTSPSAAPDAIDLIVSAAAEDPSGLAYRLALARLETRLGRTDAARADFAKALELDPNEVSIYLDYGDALMHMGLPAEAAEQYKLALKFNDLLPVEEPKRLNDALIESRLTTATGRGT